MRTFLTFPAAIDRATLDFKTRSQLVHTAKWQGVDISQKPEMATYELLNYSFTVLLPEDMNPTHYHDKIHPNIPWADDHFLERVNGQPLNPGVQWAKWPYAKSADRFRDKDGIFTHTYMERYWPKYAGLGPDPSSINHGYRYNYGDLNDVVNQLVKDPLTRQAYLPVWFPEDTGALHGGRLPCSLGYHFILRDAKLHIIYYLRSCDYVRHFRDDIYLTLRLLMWVIEECRKLDKDWDEVVPGSYTMHITSFHLFKADWVPLFGTPR